ncbi:ABC transporter ATP-binding protein [Macrococcus hajekii]|uniref:ABC transporter ATP-binding protein n=1 Tax=Macrococcus hajekii TaxID=198482 RepID=A0A4R6BJB6_9STAP|nr:ABC transporter ATP-binding protein [Macrococcus hajekii]TDM01792.1 ABC transporter ATP-binding protein [Macrococcus hajekii]GGB07515.1 putative ABC transporter ATP-binding protein YhcH [Macrococcus hajekii]
MEENISLSVSHLKKDIGKRTIINDVNFAVRKGEVFGFLGPNGAGKTTTIRMIVGLTSPTAGDITILGHPITTERAQAMEHVGAIVENPELYPFLSGLENLKQFARMQKAVSREDIDRVVKLVGLEHSIKDKVKKYSLGMRQRLGLAQALLHNPSILILDEPTNGLDPQGIREIRDYIRKLAREEGLSVIVSSHLLSEMEMMCDRIGIIQHGQMISIEDVHQTSTANDVVTHRFDVYPVDAAEHYFSSLGIQSMQENGLVVQVKQKDVPELVRGLVKADVDVYSIVMNKETLEERFLKMTGGEQHV